MLVFKKMLNVKWKLLLTLLLFVEFFDYIVCFNVKFRNFYDADVERLNTQIHKREMTQFFDKASYSFNGFEKIESIPVLFPIDICILKLDEIKYATSLYKHSAGENHFAVFKMNNGSYNTIADIRTPKAIAMDCIGVGSIGYIAIAFNYSTPVENAREGSPIYQLDRNDRLRAIQYFSSANLFNVYLRSQGNNIMLLQTFQNTKSTSNIYCPYYSWTGSTFNRIGRIPCSNARRLEPFSIDHENYVAVANYADQRGRTSTYSEIYKFMKDKKKFQLFQKIKTNGAVDVRFFRVPIDEFRQQNFLLFGNSLADTTGKNHNHKINDDESSVEENGNGKKLEGVSIFYIFERGQFVPYQSLTVYALEQFLPIQNVDAEKFLLLVSSKSQDIKIYNLNDWKFEESSAQFTEGALGKGVARMRIFQEHEDSYLIVANELMAANETNIFLPIFKQEEHANALRQQIIDWSKASMERLSRINVDKLRSDVEQKLSKLSKSQVRTNLKFNRIASANISTVITQTLDYPRLHISSYYWKSLDYANRALNALESQVSSQRTQHRRQRRDHNNLYDFEHMRISTLHVKNKLSTKYVNGIVSNAHPTKFDSVNAKEVIVTERYTAPKRKSSNFDNFLNSEMSMPVLNVQKLQLTGKINDINWNELINDTLKSNGTQMIKSNSVFGKLLTSNRLNAHDNKINELSLDKIVRIDNGSFVVPQDVLFAEPVVAKEFIIKNRLNQISINQKKMDVLLKRSNNTQIVKGQKRLHNIRLLQPLQVAGSLSGNHLRAVSPNKAIHDNLVLQGEYVINGNVIITKSLDTEDLLWNSRNTSSARSVLSNGLNIDLPLQDVNMMFEHDVKANNSIISFVNTKDMQQLIRTNTAALQIVNGLKIFKNGLNIENGLSDVKFLNNFNVENLESQLLLKNTNQTIKGEMQVERILARGLKSSSLTLNRQNLTNFLTKSKNQYIKGSLNVNTLDVESLNAKDLNINGKIYNRSLAEIYQMKSKTLSAINVFRKDQKFGGNIYVNNLKINSSLNEKSVDDLENFLHQLNGNIKYVGNFKVNYKMNLTNLTFNGQFNGISAKNFGKCWLEKNGEQAFTAVQTIDSVQFDKGATINEKLNGYFLKDFIENTYWIDRDEFIKDAIFLSPILLEMPFETGTLNQYLVPDDLLYKSFEQMHILKAPITIQKDLKIQGSILNATTLNDIHLGKLQTFLRETGRHTDKLFVEHANFSYTPVYRTLNKYDLHKTLDRIWLTNDNIDLLNDVEIGESIFQGLLHFEGPVNNINLRYLNQNYLSKSKEQVISAKVMFAENLTFESDVIVDQIKLMAPIIESESLRLLDFNEFVSNSLKNSGRREIYGNWTILEASTFGDIQNVAINNLDLATDAVRLNAPNIVTAEKHIDSANIETMYPKDGSYINNVDITNWIYFTAYTNRNQTIYGQTILDNANLGHIQVDGLVNDRPFDGKHLLINDKPQTVYGTYTFRNKFPNEQRTLSNNIKNLYAERINGFKVDTFLKNLTKLTSSESSNNVLNTHLIFEQPLFLTQYESSSTKRESMKWKRNILNNEIMEEDQQNLYDLEKITQDLTIAVKDIESVLNDFELSQVIFANATKIIPLTIRMDNEIIKVIGLINKSISQHGVKFYYWNSSKHLFLPNDTNLPWLPQDPFRLDMINLIFGAEYLTLKRPKVGEVYKQNISDNGFEEMLDLTQNGASIEPLRLQEKDCFAIYGKNSLKSISIYCLNLSAENISLKLNMEYEIKKNAQQVIALSSSQFAILDDENSIEIWNTSTGVKRHQLLKTTTKAKFLAKGQIDGITYLAVAYEKDSNSLLPAQIDIYSGGEGSDFKYLQTLEIRAEPQQIMFSFLEVSHDLMLFVRSNALDQPLLIYQLRGVMNFQIFGGPKTLLEPAYHMQMLEVMNNYFIVLFSPGRAVSFIDLKFRNK